MKTDSKKYVSIGEAANLLGVTTWTMMNWDNAGKFVAERTPTNRRMYLLADVQSYKQSGKADKEKATVGYARVSSHDQKEDLDRQCGVLESYCAKCGWQFELIKDLGSGMNYNKKGLRQLLEMLFEGKINRLVITHKDRLLRFGAELIFNICEIKNVEVVIINQGDTPKSYEEELAADIIEIITVFSAKLYGSRSHKNKKLLEQMQKAADVAESAT
jgi:predicted site-specific integrase-resolvase